MKQPTKASMHKKPPLRMAFIFNAYNLNIFIQVLQSMLAEWLQEFFHHNVQDHR